MSHTKISSSEEGLGSADSAYEFGLLTAYRMDGQKNQKRPFGWSQFDPGMFSNCGNPAYIRCSALGGSS